VKKTLLNWGLIFGLPILVLTLCLASAAHAVVVNAAFLHSPHLLVGGTTIGAGAVTLLDWAKQIDPDGKTATVAELLSQTNEILEDMVWKEGNLPTGERIIQETGLPAVYYRLLNQGVAKSKGTTAQIDEQCAILEARSEIDADIVDLNGNTAAFRLSAARRFIESMNQSFANTLIYGNSGANPEQFTGLAIRYSSLSAANADNIITGGGSGSDNTSIYLGTWGTETGYGIFPKGSKAGLVHEDLGLGDAFDGSNNRFRAYMDRWQWKGGFALKDWRYFVRIANIDKSDLIADGSGATVKLIEYMAKAIDRIPNPGMGKMVFYCNRTLKSMLRIQAMNKSVAQLGFEPAINQFGKSIHQLTFLGIPVRTVDKILNTEAAVS
jgi:hypothetical protein